MFKTKSLFGSGASFNGPNDSTEMFQESTVVRLEWTIRDLKQLFDSSKGDGKSKVLKSVKFGGGRWQILFYPNSGTEGGQYISLYLSCEPTSEEKDNALNGRWIREGQYKFSFELRNLSKTILFNQKEANDHCFSWKTANWGWAQFARRDAVYYQPNVVRQQDAFLIICIISSSPAAPILPPAIPSRSVPRELLDVIGCLLDDPTYSDVEFVLPGRGRKHGSRRLYAARAVLKRAEYFESMFGSGFAESSEPLEFPNSQSDLGDGSQADQDAELSGGYRQYEDSDIEDEVEMTDIDENMEESEDNQINDIENWIDDDVSVTPVQANSVLKDGQDGDESAKTSIIVTVEDSTVNQGENEEGANVQRNVRAKINHPSSPRQSCRNTRRTDLSDQMDKNPFSSRHRSPRGPSKIRVVVKDVAYSTYRAVLYYLYTDSIAFAPLASSFIFQKDLGAGSSVSPAPAKSQGEGQNSIVSSSARQSERSNFGPTTRRAWIREWQRQNPGKGPPCSAKAVYRIADKLNLEELKNRAFQHIVRSLTVENVPYEMFSHFSAMFEDVRKTQIAFFLENWNEIRSAESMKSIWQQIRVGRHPGFEEVWPLIAMNLEFKPRSLDATTGDSRETGFEP